MVTVLQTVKRFPLKGGGMTQLNKIHPVLKRGHPHTTHHLSPSQFPKAEGCNSLVSSFFQPLFNSLSVPLPLPLIPHSLISCVMRPFSGICGLIIADNHSSFLSLPLFLFLSGSAVDSGAKSVNALQRPKTTC